MSNPTPSARSVKEAAAVIQSQTSGESLLCGPDRIEITEELTNAIAIALDQRERDTWRDAARVVENLDRCDDENGPTGCSEIHYTISQGRVKDAARSALLSEAERRGMGSKSGDGK